MPVVETLEEGINTPIGENGNRLSGGQRQRGYCACDVP